MFSCSIHYIFDEFVGSGAQEFCLAEIGSVGKVDELRCRMQE